jgi:tRNA (cytidine/uridine-2'-O-)-methyltransferase
MNIVLVEPEIPQNTGNIARTCAATGAALHLIEPLGFSIEDKYLKRAGLDYWDLVTVKTYRSLPEFFEKNPGMNGYYVTTKAPRAYTEVAYAKGDCLIFGKETRGLPEALLRQNYARCVRIPMDARARSLNLSNAVAIVLYEALRQTGFDGFATRGQLTGRDDRSAWADYV